MWIQSCCRRGDTPGRQEELRLAGCAQAGQRGDFSAGLGLCGGEPFASGER